MILELSRWLRRLTTLALGAYLIKIGHGVWTLHFWVVMAFCTVLATSNRVEGVAEVKLRMEGEKK